MKKLQVIAFALILGTIFCLGRQAPVYGASAQSSAESNPPASAPNHSKAQVELGSNLFQQNCAFCHGRDAGGGETGPDLTRSKLVAQDVAGSKIAPVVRQGRAGKGMPSFNFSASDLDGIVAFIHAQRTKALSQNGSRRGVEAADLQTGNATAGKAYFNGAGGCTSCHSATGDLSGIASRYQGLELERRMLYPKDAESTVTVTFSSGKTVTGTLAYLDEFTVGITDANGTYHSWPVGSIRYTVSSPADAHVALFSKYTDADIHNLMAYMQTLR